MVQMADRIEQHIANSGFKNLAVQWLIENLCFVSSSVVVDSFRLRNPPQSLGRSRATAGKLFKNLSHLPNLSVLLV